MEKHKKRTALEQISLLTARKTKVKNTLKRINKETQKLKIRIYKQKLNNINTKFLEKILSNREKCYRSIQWRLASIENEIRTLSKGSWYHELSLLLQISIKKLKWNNV